MNDYYPTDPGAGPPLPPINLGPGPYIGVGVVFFALGFALSAFLFRRRKRR